MDVWSAIFRKTRTVALGEGICATVMTGIFALLGRAHVSVLLGAIAGAVLAVGNFFFMAVSTSLAADKAEAQDVTGARLLIRNSYMLRLAVLFALLFVCAKSGAFDLLALVLPLVFVRPVLAVDTFIRRKGDA